MKLKSLNRKIIVHRMRAVENADGVSGLEAECEIDLHFYNSCTTGEKGYTHIIGIEGGRIKWDSF